MPKPGVLDIQKRFYRATTTLTHAYFNYLITKIKHCSPFALRVCVGELDAYIPSPSRVVYNVQLEYVVVACIAVSSQKGLQVCSVLKAWCVLSTMLFP